MKLTPPARVMLLQNVTSLWGTLVVNRNCWERVPLRTYKSKSKTLQIFGQIPYHVLFADASEHKTYRAFTRLITSIMSSSMLFSLWIGISTHSIIKQRALGSHSVPRIKIGVLNSLVLESTTPRAPTAMPRIRFSPYNECIDGICCGWDDGRYGL